MARDIKFNLRSQTNKLENKTLKNLFGIQRSMVQSNRLVNMIKTARQKNKMIMYGIVTLLILSLGFIIYVSIFSGSSEVVHVQQQPLAPNLADPSTESTESSLPSKDSTSVQLPKLPGDGGDIWAKSNDQNVKYF